VELFVIATRVSGESVRSVRSFEVHEREAFELLQQRQIPVKWIDSYSLLGPYDRIDLVELPSLSVAMQLAIILRSLGHDKVEVWPASKRPPLTLPATGEQDVADEQGEAACGWTR
jgi:uncharacterized protein with GYD domain